MKKTWFIFWFVFFLHYFTFHDSSCAWVWIKRWLRAGNQSIVFQRTVDQLRQAAVVVCGSVYLMDSSTDWLLRCKITENLIKKQNKKTSNTVLLVNNILCCTGFTVPDGSCVFVNQNQISLYYPIFVSCYQSFPHISCQFLFSCSNEGQSHINKHHFMLSLTVTQCPHAPLMETFCSSHFKQWADHLAAFDSWANTAHELFLKELLLHLNPHSHLSSLCQKYELKYPSLSIHPSAHASTQDISWWWGCRAGSRHRPWTLQLQQPGISPPLSPQPRSDKWDRWQWWGLTWVHPFVNLPPELHGIASPHPQHITEIITGALPQWSLVFQ